MCTLADDLLEWCASEQQSQWTGAWLTRRKESKVRKERKKERKKKEDETNISQRRASIPCRHHVQPCLHPQRIKKTKSFLRFHRTNHPPANNDGCNVVSTIQIERKDERKVVVVSIEMRAV